MAEPAAMSVESNTPEKIALELMQMIAHIEKKALHSGPAQGWTAADRGWLLATYSECIQAVRADSPAGPVTRVRAAAAARST